MGVRTKPLTAERDGILASAEHFRAIRADFGASEIIGEEFDAVFRASDVNVLGRVLPRVVKQTDGFLFQLFVRGQEVVSKTRPLGENESIPESDELINDIKTLRERAQRAGVNPERRRQIEAFKLPARDAYPEFYRTYVDGDGSTRLVILWGIESRHRSGLPIEQVSPFDPKTIFRNVTNALSGEGSAHHQGTERPIAGAGVASPVVAEPIIPLAPTRGNVRSWRWPTAMLAALLLLTLLFFLLWLLNWPGQTATETATTQLGAEARSPVVGAVGGAEAPREGQAATATAAPPGQATPRAGVEPGAPAAIGGQGGQTPANAGDAMAAQGPVGAPAGTAQQPVGGTPGAQAGQAGAAAPATQGAAGQPPLPVAVAPATLEQLVVQPTGGGVGNPPGGAGGPAAAVREQEAAVGQANGRQLPTGAPPISVQPTPGRPGVGGVSVGARNARAVGPGQIQADLFIELRTEDQTLLMRDARWTVAGQQLSERGASIAITRPPGSYEVIVEVPRSNQPGLMTFVTVDLNAATATVRGADVR